MVHRRHLLYANHSRSTFEPVLDLGEGLADDCLVSYYKKSDRLEPPCKWAGPAIPDIKDALSVA